MQGCHISSAPTIQRCRKQKLFSKLYYGHGCHSDSSRKNIFADVVFSPFLSSCSLGFCFLWIHFEVNIVILGIRVANGVQYSLSEAFLLLWVSNAPVWVGSKALIRSEESQSRPEPTLQRSRFTPLFIRLPCLSQGVLRKKKKRGKRDREIDLERRPPFHTCPPTETPARSPPLLFQNRQLSHG